MLFKKFSPGVVEQTFNDAGECIGQKFVIHDHGGVEWETEDGDPINSEQTPLAGREYFPFNMIQPNDEMLALLEKLLSATERQKPTMTDDELRTWCNISAKVADLRDGEDV